MATSKHSDLVLMLGAVVLLGFLSPASALSCHWCLPCDDPFNATWALSCTGQYCYTGTTYVLGSKVINRDCLDTSPGYTRGCRSFSESGATGTICVCDRDYCNVSHRLQVLPYLLPLLLLGSYVLLKSQRTP